jgi:hypothetical protein
MVRISQRRFSASKQLAIKIGIEPKYPLGQKSARED